MLRKMLTTGLCAMVLSLSAAAFAADVYVTKNGKRYHQQDCRLIQKREVEVISQEEAAARGLTPCKVCSREEAKGEQGGESEGQQAAKKGQKKAK